MASRCIDAEVEVAGSRVVIVVLARQPSHARSLPPCLVRTSPSHRPPASSY